MTGSTESTDLFAGCCVCDFAASARGIEPDSRVTYPRKARKAIYVDPDRNGISYGGADAPA